MRNHLRPILSLAAALAVSVCSAGCGSLRGWWVERRHPATGERRTIGGVSWHWTEAGPRRANAADTCRIDESVDLRPVVFVHGSFSTLHSFAESEAFRELSRSRPCYAVDRPGSGYSSRPGDEPLSVIRQADLLAAWIDALGLERPILVGHSSGGAVALAHAVRHGAQAEAYVLINPVALPFPADESSERLARSLRWVASPIAGRLLVETVLPVVYPFLEPRLRERAFAPNRPPEGLSEAGPALSLRPRQFRGECRDLLTLPSAIDEISAHYGEIRRPVTILIGDEDQLAPPELQGERLHELLPSSRLIRVEGTGHMLHLVEPELTRRAIEQALATGGVSHSIADASHEHHPAGSRSPRAPREVVPRR